MLMHGADSVPNLLLILHKRRATQNLITRPECCTYMVSRLYRILLSALRAFVMCMLFTGWAANITQGSWDGV